jgi:sugar phosphate isomerase/epimerase
MRLAISNIAWDVTEDEQVAGLLRAAQVDAIDVAPGKYFPDPAVADATDIRRVRAWWAGRGIEITGMQALLFGTSGLNMFGETRSQAAMIDRLASVCRLGAGLGARCLVFGSPKNRDRQALADDEVQDIAVRFFRRLGDVAAEHDVVICLEPNPPAYGCNFMIDTDEAAAVVRLVGHPAVRLQLDTGALALNDEDPEQILARHGELIGHAHASEPHLVVLGDGDARHADVARAISRHASIGLITIEMVAATAEPHLVAIGRAIRLADRFYRSGAGGQGGPP